MQAARNSMSPIEIKEQSTDQGNQFAPFPDGSFALRRVRRCELALPLGICEAEKIEFRPDINSTPWRNAKTHTITTSKVVGQAQDSLCSESDNVSKPPRPPMLAFVEKQLHSIFNSTDDEDEEDYETTTALKWQSSSDHSNGSSMSAAPGSNNQTLLNDKQLENDKHTDLIDRIEAEKLQQQLLNIDFTLTNQKSKSTTPKWNRNSIYSHLRNIHYTAAESLRNRIKKNSVKKIKNVGSASSAQVVNDCQSTEQQKEYHLKPTSPQSEPAENKSANISEPNEQYPAGTGLRRSKRGHVPLRNYWSFRTTDPTPLYEVLLREQLARGEERRKKRLAKQIAAAKEAKKAIKKAGSNATSNKSITTTTKKRAATKAKQIKKK